MSGRGIIIFLILALPAISWSADVKDSLSGNLLQVGSFKPVVIRNLPPEVDALEYGDNELPHAIVRDLNGDGAPDYLIAAHPTLCGTGGCPYLLVDGRSRSSIGEFFGTIALLKRRINDYPVIQSVSKHDSAAITVSTYVFDGKEYQPVASSLLEEQGIASWKATLDQEKQP